MTYHDVKVVSFIWVLIPVLFRCQIIYSEKSYQKKSRVTLESLRMVSLIIRIQLKVLQKWGKCNDVLKYTFVLQKAKIKCRSRYLVCSEYKRLVCRARAMIPANGTKEELVLTREHNHPPIIYAEEKNNFIQELKNVIKRYPHNNLRDIYDIVQEM